ncbi:MAG: MinD/ParA family protein [Desulfovibrio sp.]|jgi:flagellar biosynthesis protein FlhG|nr:MinD/ParA family protein [Desulfovibrio sp.]
MSRNTTLSVAIVSGKGGVGKTNVSLNLSLALHRKGFRVLLLDCDLGLANLDVLLGITPDGNMQNVLLGERDVRSVLHHVTSKGFDVMPAASGVPELSEMKPETRELLLSRLAPLLGEYDFVFMDLGAGISETVQNFSVMAGARVLIISPEPTSLTDGYALVKLLNGNYGMRDFLVLVNMVDSKKHAQESFDKFSAACSHFLHLQPVLLGHVRNDPKFPEAVRKQQPLLTIAPGCPAAQDIQAIAERLQRIRLDMGDWLANRQILQDIPLRKA